MIGLSDDQIISLILSGKVIEVAIWARVPTGWVKPERKMLKRHQSQSWSRFGRLNLFAKMNEKIWGNIVCKTGTILDVSEQGTFSQSRKDAHQMKRPIWGSWSMWRWLSKEEGHKAMSLLSFCWTVDVSHLAFVGVYDSWCHIITYWHQMVVSPSNSW